MKNNKFYIALLAATLSLTSCSNEYLDVNENPNQIHAENITPELMFPGAVSQAYRTQATTMMQFGNLMMNSWTGNAYTNSSPFQREFNLQSVDNTFYQGIWNGLYPRIANFAQIEKFSNTDHKQDYYIAMAKIMKSYYMQYIVDLYGDAPFSEAFLGQLNMKPKYDNDADIYRALVTNINEAIALISNASPDAINPADKGADIVFQGNMSNWQAFGRTLKLRMLLRMSKVTGDMATFRDAQLQTLSGATFINVNVLENPGYNGSNDDQMSPFLLNWRVNSAGSAVTNYPFITVSEHMAIALNGNVEGSTETYHQKYTGIPDPRRTGLFTAVIAPSYLKGIRQGAVPGQPGAPVGNTTVSRLANGTFSGTTGLSLVSGNRGGVIMSLAESKLLQAEASLRYPAIFGAVAQTRFIEAIDASGAWLGTSATALTTYKGLISTRTGLGWTGTDNQKLEAIMTQKWIALTNVNPTEMFIEYNRTGYPTTPMATTAGQPNKPYRLIYPVSEYATNSANVPNISSSQVFVKNQFTPFWNQN
ncbi:SusD/RagB family nutrient-binding outer membrane lipoprotein [Chryseobacterium sp. APV1]|uniref:SusD/RagB family nutrient-binding outer membrane lipoprotein n=1 Tax=Chryseobacterium urinae TaxID=3058400 RepID=A0ABT8U5V3_9FLAO|nr:SusD/RagB family nutrient-binding outer membrane lipoprotein [Chryseobacterium sp. APV1]MDO3426438.1 SusD/RagB family nutrient-binding outer membrane lipoprotein [Chryseobacterium sp. APV1]